MPSIISLENVHFSYGDHSVLEGVNLTVPEGDFAMVVGPNGGGKTTLLKLILGLLKPKKGQLHLFGEPPKNTWSQVGYMPQYTHVDMAFPVSVLDVVLMGSLHGPQKWRYTRNDRKQAHTALEEVGLNNVASRPFSALSGGQRQRVLIARALASQPRLLLMDEPTANVDPASEASLFDLLKELNSRMTILMVSHDLGLVSQVVKSVICVNRRVHIHPTSELNGTLIQELYGGHIKFVRHDHRCSDHGHRIDDTLQLASKELP
ncbi:MAG: ABC transporter ATP-binding protein [Desulfobacterales bacterium]|nr:ABC transporter ATP-binding protein [Desulfobacterales bacterium]